MIQAATSAYNNWPRYGRSLPGAKALVQYTQPTTMGMVLRTAKLIGRATVMNGVVGATASSAYAVFF